MVQVLFILIKLSPTFRWSLILLLPIYENHQTLFRYNIDIASCLHNILLQFNPPLVFEWLAVVSSIYKCFYWTFLKIKLCWEQKTEILRQYTWKILRISRNIKLCCHQKNWGDHQNLPFDIIEMETQKHWVSFYDVQKLISKKVCILQP